MLTSYRAAHEKARSPAGELERLFDRLLLRNRNRTTAGKPPIAKREIAVFVSSDVEKLPRPRTAIRVRTDQLSILCFDNQASERRQACEGIKVKKVLKCDRATLAQNDARMTNSATRKVAKNLLNLATASDRIRMFSIGRSS
jgi:hypothetical protein